MTHSSPPIGSDIPPRAAEVELTAICSVIHAGGSTTPGIRATYLDLRRRKITDLLGQWVSGIEPLLFEQYDVSPTVLLIVGIAAPGFLPSRFVAEVTTGELSAAMGWSS